MRAVDYKMADALKSEWQGKAIKGTSLCPLLADLDRLITYLDHINFKTGHSLNPCPECGEDHRGALMVAILRTAAILRPNSTSQLLTYITKEMESKYALYGGKEGYDKMCEDADKFFATLGSADVYRP